MATNQQNINIGTADNANDGDALRNAFRKVRKMFAEIYGDTDAENLTDTEVVLSTNFDTHITEKIQDTVSGMFSNGTQTNVTVTYDDSDGSIDLNVAADITDVNAGNGLTGVNEDGGAATINVGAGDGITVNADDVALASSVAGAGLSYASGVLSVDAINTDGIANDAVTAAKIALFDDDLAATDTHVLVADGTDFNNVALSGDATITNTGVLTIAANAVTTAKIINDAVTHDKLENRFTAVASITTLTGTVSFDCSTASVFKLSGDLTGAYTIDLTGYKKGQVISIFPLKGQTVTLDAQGSSTNTFNKLAEADYDNTVTSLLQIECVDDSATDPVFFYSVATFASDSSI
jgi:hypothetical protein